MLCRTLLLFFGVCVRHDISLVEKGRLLLSFFLMKLGGGNTLHFLGYVIHTSSRANCLGILKEIFLKGEYAFMSTTKTPRIIDAGGNVGLATFFFKRYFPKARITVFEAAPQNFKLLQKNIEQNHLADTTLILGMLGKTENTEYTFYYNAGNPGSSTGISEVARSKTRGIFTEERVPAILLSAYVTEEVDLLKMDVEGAEGEILEDLENTGALARIRQIVMEFHYNESNPKNRLVDVLNLFERNGFSVALYDNEHGVLGREMQATPMYHFMIRAYKKAP